MLTIFRILLGLAVVAGVGLGSFYLVRAIEDTTPEQVMVESPTATATPLPTSTPAPAPTMIPPSPTPEAALPTMARPTPMPSIPWRASLELPDAGEIMMDANGKYFIADRGDGYPWFEFARSTFPSGKAGETWTEVSFYTPCETGGIFFTYRLETGEVFPTSP
jgi:hypothetical protein